MTVQNFAGELLTFIELREQRLLSWGFYNIRQSAQEIEDAFQSDAPPQLTDSWRELEEQGLTFRRILQQMTRRGLLYSVPGAPDSYRTRFSEGVRLFADLRQLFRPQDWAIGPRLVSDIKLHVASRAYPRRDRQVADV